MDSQGTVTRTQALLYMALFHVIDQLSRGVDILLNTRDEGSEPSDETRLLATGICQCADGWQLFCTRLGVASDDVLGPVPGSATLIKVEKMARPLQLYVDPATDGYKRFGVKEGDYPTAERTCAKYRAHYDKLIGAAS